MTPGTHIGDPAATEQLPWLGDGALTVYGDAINPVRGFLACVLGQIGATP